MYNDYAPFYIGIKTSVFDNIYAQQADSMLCWAACLEMVTRHYGMPVSQIDFAKNSCGTNRYGIPYNCPASFEIITNSLNFSGRDGFAEYTFKAPLIYGAPSLSHLYNELLNHNPIIIAHQNQNSKIGHAVLLTGMAGYYLNGIGYVTSLVIRDPWPSFEHSFTLGRNVITNIVSFMNNISAYWIPSLTMKPIEEPIWLDM
ncbi:MAG: hypothetical protein JSS82_11150 [Bacteroidetes bacterium]|nr:hypothetical protein [Bacteroidota bacterium]